MRVRIQTYKARVTNPLQFALAINWLWRLKNDSSTFKARAGDAMINWGCTESNFSDVPGITWLNHPAKVAAKASKLAQYQKFAEHGVPSLKFTTDPAEALVWYGKRHTVFCRVRDTAFGGRGIVVANPASGLPGLPPEEAAVYTREFNARREYRVHVFRGEVIDVTQKRRKDGTDTNAVRSYGNGYIFSHHDVEPYPEALTAGSIAAVSALGLDFGAVDILCKDSGAVAVLEVNAAPGLKGTSLAKYTAAIDKWVKEVRAAA